MSVRDQQLFKSFTFLFACTLAAAVTEQVILMHSLMYVESELTEIHDVVPTDSTVIHHNVPGPQRHSIPLEKNKHGQTNK